MAKDNNSRIIYLVDDDEDDQEILSAILKQIAPDISVMVFDEGKAMLEKLVNPVNGDLPNLIILDHNMPGLSGADVLKCLKENTYVKNVPKLMWSVSTNAGFREECLHHGANDYFNKPSDYMALYDMAFDMLLWIKRY